MKVYIVFKAEKDNLGYIKNEIKPIKIFTSRKLAENYCNWRNKNNEPILNEWICYRRYIIERIDYSKIQY